MPRRVWLTLPNLSLHIIQRGNNPQACFFVGEDYQWWSIWVNGNWRITFEFQDGNAYVLDYEDYH